MTEAALRGLFAGMPGLHGLAEAALSGWHGCVQPVGEGALLSVGDFILCGGAPGPAGEDALTRLIAAQPREWLIYAPGPWECLIRERMGFRPVTRYGFRPLAPGTAGNLTRWERLPAGYTMGLMERRDAEACLQAAWSRDFVREHGSADNFMARGLGVMIRDACGQPVAGASAYVSWPAGLEVQLQTREDAQGLGLATAAAARLLRAAGERGRAVCWDAANIPSARIAARLGFAPTAQYTAWALTWPCKKEQKEK